MTHRDYASNASFEVRVFSDRIEVWNPGELPPGKTIEWLFGDHDSMPFNPLIAQAMYQVRYVEHVGSGIEDIEAACAEAGLPRTTVMVRNRTVIHTIWRKPAKENVAATKETTKERVATTKERGNATQEGAAAAKEIPAELLRGLEVLSEAHCRRAGVDGELCEALCSSAQDLNCASGTCAIVIFSSMFGSTRSSF